ncbi:3-hydroxyacyl-ACP dehydratase FabZ [Desulfobulbus sp. US1]|uniref:3-hydroxyacyl-[acyl-carrier-protein] dehydratase FabZ n=1 Tax=Candidatus Electrothrix communis TaxID=1859133 RepID=A0A3S3R448_9BACT|nr:3-hydroxyacyl-ACP dehydratase FabZ [Desulfobulbus sp. US4]MCW5207518.1 3-hydroxyacyl-ACP dehydratase FabZ [Desulfobulbus sp. US2]MCW5209598.1 3-hydroxyacyl-ACP dehydratase FabZ [Desulfobulbus sp. US1]MCW5210882.1 3-hydroxyacyl-ACP dehydratase FabZ [Desulfobulbus sp. N3]MCW5214003.1 3-hydroxyacyl-ACP dehydratase FabZ [Desulfobulbus sp. US5]RWX49689.1 3-hydroxyacyl-[acyl-carrier-protein] dehydratase [Candidatus Electrothrix communis]
MTEDKKVQLPMGIKEILDLLPHRYPFIMLDRVLEFEHDKTITGLKNVSMGEPFFQGHFPGEPVMPGVLILEGMAQAGAVLAYLSTEDIAGKLVYFAGMDKVRFRKVVRPGDQLIYKVEMVRRKSKLIKVQCKAYVDDILVTEAEQLATFS